MIYASYTEFSDVAHQAKPSDADKFRTLLERASRIFDLLCGVEPNHFQSVTYALWQSNTKYEVGDIVVPTTSNVHKYRVTTAGTSGASEPTWPTGSGATVVNGTVTFTENGTDVIATTEKVIYGTGIGYLKLPPYVAGSIAVDGVEMPSGYTVPSYVESNGYLIVKDATTGVLLSPGYYSDGWGQYWFGGGWEKNVPLTITARWGYDGVSEDIKQVVIKIAMLLWRSTDPAFTRTADLPAIQAELDETHKAILDKYRIKKAVAFA